MTPQEIKQILFKLFPELNEKLSEEEKEKLLEYILAVKDSDVVNFINNLNK